MAPEWDELRKRYDVRVLDTWAYGSRHLTSNRPIRHPVDLKGFRLRSPAARIFQASSEALGASPTPIAPLVIAQQQPLDLILPVSYGPLKHKIHILDHVFPSLTVGRIHLRQPLFLSLSNDPLPLLLRHEACVFLSLLLLSLSLLTE